MTSFDCLGILLSFASPYMCRVVTLIVHLYSTLKMIGLAIVISDEDFATVNKIFVATRVTKYILFAMGATKRQPSSK